MTYYHDLSPYCYLGAEPDTLNVGWLDDIHPYTTGDIPAGFVERLEAFLNAPVHGTFGGHRCELCRNETWGEEIRVFGEGEIVYAAPTMIYHYINDHHYLPPAEFIQAVLHGPLPGSQEYSKRASQYSWKGSVNYYTRKQDS